MVEQIDQRRVGKKLVIRQSMTPHHGLPTEVGPDPLGQTNPKCRHLGASNDTFETE
jgi:hypothetical protein